MDGRVERMVLRAVRDCGAAGAMPCDVNGRLPDATLLRVVVVLGYLTAAGLLSEGPGRYGASTFKLTHLGRQRLGRRP